MRRRTVAVSGRIELADGSVIPVTRETFTQETERALRALCGATVAIALALVILRVT
jgi:hypothetical protein